MNLAYFEAFRFHFFVLFLKYLSTCGAKAENTAGLGLEYLHFCKLTFLLRTALIKEISWFFFFFFIYTVMIR